MATRRTITRQTLAQEVASRLRDEILSGELTPGQRLVVPALEQSFGVSHIPIREALRELQAESLLQPAPGPGVVVAGVDIAELHDLYDLRRLIELHVLERAHQHYTPGLVASFHDPLEALEALRPEQHEGDWWAAHKQFHWAFLEPGMTPWARRLLHLIWQSSERYQRLFTLVFGSVDEANEKHRELVEAARGAFERLLRLWVEHLDYTEMTISDGYDARHHDGHELPRSD